MLLVDERDISRETEYARFRVWQVRDEYGAVAVYEFSEATFEDVERWAEANASFGYSIAMVYLVDGVLECLWLRGRDPNDVDYGSGGSRKLAGPRLKNRLRNNCCKQDICVGCSPDAYLWPYDLPGDGRCPEATAETTVVTD